MIVDRKPRIVGVCHGRAPDRFVRQGDRSEAVGQPAVPGRRGERLLENQDLVGKTGRLLIRALEYDAPSDAPRAKAAGEVNFASAGTAGKIE